MVCGIDAAIGYGLGVMFAAIWRAFADREPRPPRRWSWRAFLLAAVVACGVSFGLGQYWQHEIRQLNGVTSYSLPRTVATPVVAAVLFAVLLLIGRGLRGLYRAVARVLQRHMGQRAARTLGWLMVAGATYLAVSGLLLNGFVSAANSAFSLRNAGTPDGVHQPTTALRSGGPGSLIGWKTLGQQGRKFTGLGPTAADITAFAHQTAPEPIRIYAGLDSAGSSEARATLAAADLERAGGFARRNLLVVTATGSGWVDPALSDTFEYLSRGDSAVVSMQYSYLPSWLSYLVDQTKARAAGRDLFDAVYDRWSKLPPAQRPRLFVAGESLGSYGAEAAFSGEYDLRNRTDGALFVGPPNFSPLFHEFSSNRQAGSPEVAPVYRDGRTVRFTNDPSAPTPPTTVPWPSPRVLYLLHPSDPIVWWGPQLVLHKPDWIGERAGSDVLNSGVWVPFVTFWQITADLPFATGVPGGHGHRYTTGYVDAWDTVLQPDGISTADLQRLKTIIATPR